MSDARRAILFLALAACSEVLPRALEGPAIDPPEVADAAPIADASTPPPADAAPEDAGPLVLTISPRYGAADDDARTPGGPGLVLMGGGPDVEAAFSWARDRIGPGVPDRAGDVVVLGAGSADGYANALFTAFPFRSAQAIGLPPNATSRDFDAAAAIVSRAELVWYVGGQQSTYAAWAGTSLAKAVQGVWDRGGVVGGTSAGALILGAFVFDALKAGLSEYVTPEVAITDPFDARISFTRHMFAFGPLADAITDVHFEERDRMGRLAMFMARQHTDGAIVRKPASVLGVGIDEDAALVIDGSGIGKIFPRTAKGRVFVVRGGPPQIAAPGQRLVYPSLEVHRLDDPAQTFDFSRWCGTAPVYTIDLGADAAAPFGASPYDRPGVSSPCP